VIFKSISIICGNFILIFVVYKNYIIDKINKKDHAQLLIVSFIDKEENLNIFIRAV
jgi:hypothetical protein